MHILVTAGNTLTPIDKVRGITNIFTGRTGAGIAIHAHERGHHVTLLTSHPETIADALGSLTVREFLTFDDLSSALQSALTTERIDAVIHCAAVSDYRPTGIYAPSPATHFEESTGTWYGDGPPALLDRVAAKVKSDEPELWLRLVRTPKLIDLLRQAWGFRGLLVKFKLEVGISERELLDIAERSRRQSEADLMVANTLEGAAEWALLGPIDGNYQRIERRLLAQRLLDAIESLFKESHRG